MILPRKASAVVFDMDGLIFDTEPLYRDAIIAAAIDAGHDSTFTLPRSGLPQKRHARRIGIRRPLDKTDIDAVGAERCCLMTAGNSAPNEGGVNTTIVILGFSAAFDRVSRRQPPAPS